MSWTDLVTRALYRLKLFLPTTVRPVVCWELNILRAFCRLLFARELQRIVS